MVELLTAALIVCGAAVVLLAAVGVVRMPDPYMRIQVATKAVTLGLFCMLLAISIHDGRLEIVGRALFIMAFTALTAPVGAHLLARACYLSGVKLWERTLRDDLKGRYDPGTHRCDSKA